MKRQIYLAMKTLPEAKHIFMTRLGASRRTGTETVAVEESLDRVTAEPVFAKRSVPSFHSAAMDGIAVRAEDTYGTTERHPRTLEIGRNAVWINTGSPMPRPYDAVIMVEKLHQVDDAHVEIRSAAYPWQHVRKVGEDIVATELLFPHDHRIRPYDIGALVSAGVFSLPVRSRPRVAIIPTGSELIHHRDLKEEEPLKEGQIIEYNSLILAALVRSCAGIPVVYDTIPDDEDQIHQAIEQAVESDADVVIINAGSSAGSRDYAVHAIAGLGEILVHGIAMMPGKPTILGMVRDKPVIGNPGYAVSSTLSFEEFIKPVLHRLQGIGPSERSTVEVMPSRDIASKLGIDEFVRVHIGRVGTRFVATPLPRAAGSITTLTRAEGIIRIPALSEGVSQTESIAAELLVDEQELLKTVVIIGSHDITIDILADEIRRRGHDVRVSSGNVGSLGGLMAIRRGSCHMAGSHLLDAESGEYNLSYIERYLAGTPVSVFHLVLRDQGLIVARGNPKGIAGIEDLARKDVSFVNRQAGSGTRVLLDYKLKEAGISSESIKGYAQEEFTHMAVAVDVLSGVADVGMGICAAARALDLDFVPIEREQYDLIIPRDRIKEPNIQAVLDTVRSNSFRERVAALGGYDPSRSGEFWTERG